jgi:alkanesulfonate monooxygenase SsuD/methylene tetrahydromethanopterin reductase-like flavin-dependent oxidoreductase (luciferase family)
MGHPRILVGGRGTPRSTRIAARFADEFNMTTTDPDKIREVYGWLDGACRDAGRDPSTVTRSAMVGVLVGGDEAEVDRRIGDLLRQVGRSESDRSWFAERRAKQIAGTPDEARASLARYEAAGVDRVMLQSLIPRDLDMIDRAAEILMR